MKVYKLYKHIEHEIMCKFDGDIIDYTLLSDDVHIVVYIDTNMLLIVDQFSGSIVSQFTPNGSSFFNQ